MMRREIAMTSAALRARSACCSLCCGGLLVLLAGSSVHAQGAFTTDVQIAKLNPLLTLSDTGSGKSVGIRNRGGDLLFSSLIPTPVPGLGSTEIFQQNLVVKNDGNIGIGTELPSHRLRIKGGPAWTSSSWQGALELENGAAIAWRANALGRRFGIGHSNGGFFFFHTDGDPGKPTGSAHYDMTINDDGSVSVNVLHTEGGGDLSENFEVHAAPAPTGDRPEVAQPGFVVAIDPLNPGQLVVSNRAYDRRVAGIVSGAGGIKPAMLMGEAGSVADGKYPVALSGRVYCRADASTAAIEVGDLLTSSDTAGHAMKVTDHAQAQGAIIGKAMTSLKHGRGLVLVLVTLQ